MNNKIIFLLAFLVVLPLTAQKGEATLYFRDGTVVKGLAKIVHKEFFRKIKFRKKKGAKRILYSSEELESIEIRKKKNSKIVK